MKVDWCWACRREHPMLTDEEFEAVWQDYRRREAREHPPQATDGRSPRERLLALQVSPTPPTEPGDGLSFRQRRYRPLREAYEAVTGLTFDGDDPSVIFHYRVSYFGPPCPYCGHLLRNRNARQCFECGMDWHDMTKPVCRKKQGP